MELKGMCQHYKCEQTRRQTIWETFVFSINFASYKREPKVPHNSAVLKLLREREEEDKNAKSGVEGMNRENRNHNSKDPIFITLFLFLKIPPSSLNETSKMTNKTKSFYQ